MSAPNRPRSNSAPPRLGEATAAAATRRDEAATTIQAAFRGHQARQDLAQQSEAATKVQSAFRGHQVRKDLAQQNEATTKIQSAFRGHQVRKDLAQQNEAATKIQSAFRGHQVRKDMARQSEAATKIQAVMKGHKTRQDLKKEAAASKIQSAFRKSEFRKKLATARPELQKSMQGELSGNLADQVGDFYKREGLIRDETLGPVVKASGRLSGNWSGGVDTQKRHINAGGGEQIGTTHHTVSDHFLGFAEEGVKRLENGSVGEKAAALRFRSQVATDSLYQGPDQEKALFQLRQNLTYGPLTNDIEGDPGQGFDPTFKRRAHAHGSGMKRDWDGRTTQMHPVHNLGLLLKTGKFELTDAGADHMTASMQRARVTHDADMTGVQYQARSSSGQSLGMRQQTIPQVGSASGHFQAGSQVGKVRKKSFTD